MMHTKRTDFLGVEFDALSLSQVLRRLEQVTSDSPYAYCITPNVDHIVRLEATQENGDGLRNVYREADLCVCDSRVLSALARQHRIRLPVVPGSDLTALLFEDIIRPGDRVAIVGGDKALLDALQQRYPEVGFAHHEPPMGLAGDDHARAKAAQFIALEQARFTLIAVGSPQQELIAAQVREIGDARGMGLCIGASLDFLTERKRRAPRLLQRLGLEWAHRLATEPRRMWRRYLIEGPRVFWLAARWKNPSGRGRGSLPMLPVLAGMLLAALIAGLLWFANRPGADTAKPDTVSAADGAKLRVELPPPDLLRPLTPQEAVEENAKRAFSDRKDSPAASFKLSSDAMSRMRAVDCLTQAIYYEGASEGVEGGRAIAQVVLNRVRHPAYPASVCGVIYQGSERTTGCQFSFTCDGSLRRIPVPYLWERSRRIAVDALAGSVFAPVGHATHYHADYVLPYWADSLDKMVQLGRHIFYRLKGGLGASGTFRQRYSGQEPLPPSPSLTEVASDAIAGAEEIEQPLLADDALKPIAHENQAFAPPNSPLAADSVQPGLIIDGDTAAAPLPRTIARDDCTSGAAGGKLRPLGADDLRSGRVTDRC